MKRERQQSASSWGCELKCLLLSCSVDCRRQPLREAVSWNSKLFGLNKITVGQPLREAVSWNVLKLFPIRRTESQPLREAVSWNVGDFETTVYDGRQPLREAVSWNNTFTIFVFHSSVSLFVRLWVEISMKKNKVLHHPVSLFVRLWVEMEIDVMQTWAFDCQPLREAVSWNELVEPSYCPPNSQPLREAVSWNSYTTQSI